MGTPVDSLEIEIESSAKSAISTVDLLIKKLGVLAGKIKIDTSSIANIGKNLDFSKITDGAKVMSETVGKAGATMAQSMKPVQEETKKIARTFEQVKEPFKDLGKGFRVEGTISDIQKAVQKYTNELEKAKLKEQTLSAKGMTNTKSYENAVADVVKYENVLESLKKQLEEIRTVKPQVDFKIQGIEESERTLETFKEELRQFSEMIDVGGVETEAGIKFPVRGLEMSLEQLRSMYPEAKELISSYEAEIDRAKELSSDVSVQKIQPIDLSAFEQIGEKTRTASEQLREFGTKLSQLEVPEIRETNLEKLRSSLEKTEIKLDELRTKLANSLTMGNITESVDDRGFVRLQEQIALTEKQAEALKQKISEIGSAPEVGNVSGFERLKQSMSGVSASSKKLSGALNGIYAPLKRLNSGINKAFSGIGRLAKSMLLLGKSAKTSSKGFNLNLKTILKYGFGIRSVYILVNKLRNAIKEGMKNLVQYSAETNASVSMLVSSLATLKNASAAAVSPLLNAIAPALNKLIQLFIKAANAVNQFLSALMGRSTWIKAKDQIVDWGESVSDAAKAVKGALQPFDKLNNLTSQQAESGGGIDPGDMFETLPIESKFKDLADKVKDILRKLFAPLKEAWNREGKFVMDSWKYALDEVWKLIKDIGRDFLEVWQQEKTIKIFEDILHIIGDIGLVIGHLARNFREAWNENKTGLHILENIRDIIGVIIHNIRLAADKTVEWADKLNFSPLLEAFERFTKSLIPVADALSGVLSDFYTEVLLPLSKWTIEKGLPELLDVFTAFNEKVDWKALRDNLAEFWRHLEPFAETVGEGLIIFIQRVSDALADFLNSQEFKDFLIMIEDWMDSVTPEDVADALEKIAKALIVLKLAVLGFGAISAVTGILTTIKTFLSFFGVGGAGATSAKGIGDTSTALGGLSSAISDVAIATTAATAAVEPFKDKMFELAEANGAQTQTVEDAKEKYDGWFGSLRLVKDELHGLLLGMEGLPTTIASSVGSVDALEKAMKAIANGTIYTDEQMQKMQNTWGFTADDMEMLRQEMLDTNPALRNLADEFPALSDASAESLFQIKEGFRFLKDGVADTDDIISKLDFRFAELTPTTKDFFDRMTNSAGSLEDFNYEMQTGEQVIDGYVSSLKDTSGAIEQFRNDVVDASTNIGEGLTAGMEAVNTDSPATGFFSKFVASIKSVFGIHSPATTMYPFGENILLGVLEGFKSKFDSFTSSITQLCSMITSKLSSGLQNAKNTWSNIWNSFPSVVTNVFNRITSSLSTLVSNISSAFSSISSKIRGIGSGISGMASGGRSYSMPKIKGYAAGGFPEDGWFRASKGEYFGKFDDGTSYVSNNTQIENGIASGVEQAAYRGMMRAIKESGGMGGSSAVNVILEGDAAGMFRVFKEEYNKAANRGGYTSLDPVLS